MKRIYLLIAAGLLCAVSMQAQKRVVASLGFEKGDAIYTTPYSLTALPNGASFWDDSNTNIYGEEANYIHGDWVNVKFGDEWNEKCSDESHIGDYCFCADNYGDKQNPWDRGFKIGLEGVKELTPYRVSFWAKIDPLDKSDAPTILTSWFSQGTEELDKSIPGYGIDQNKELMSGKTINFTGDWQRIVYQVFVCKQSDIDATRNASYQGNNTFPAEYGGEGESYWEHFGEHFAPMYFFIANMFSPATYYLDDILVEENVTVKEVTYSTEIIKIDFGYANNIASLAKANSGTISLDESCVTVTQDGEPVEVAYVEGKSDGFLYVFVNEELLEDSEVVVNFTGDSKLLYTSATRPSADTTGEVAVFGFEEELAYWDEDVYAEALAYGVPTVKRSVPANASFNLLASEVETISMTFTSKVNISKAKGSLQNSKAKKDVTSLMSLSEDGLTVSVPVTAEDLTDGLNVFTIDGYQNETGTEKNLTAEISFEIGEVQGDGSALVIHQLDINSANGNIPYGYSGWGGGSWHTSTPAAPYNGSGSAPRLMPTGAPQGIYICPRPGEGNIGSLEFGKYAAIAAAKNGGTLPAYDETVPESINPDVEALWLDEGEYILEFQLPDWDPNNAKAQVFSGIYYVTIDGENVKENIVEEWDEGIPSITVGNDAGYPEVPVTTHEFTITEPGYYYVGFGNPAVKNTYSGWFLESLTISSKPESVAAYWMKQLNDEIAKAVELLNNTDEKYTGAATAALAETIEEAQNGRFTTAEEVQAIVKKLQTAKQAVSDRKTNYDNFVKKCADAQEQIETLEGKYASNEKVKDAEAILAKYDGVDPKNLSDDELAAASKDVDNIPGILSNIKNAVDLLTARAVMAAKLADALWVDEEVVDRLNALSTDATAIINDANIITTQALYESIADDMYDALWEEPQYSDQVNSDYDETDVEQAATHDDYGHPLKYAGIDMTSYIKNPNFYTTGTVQANVDFPGWTFEPLEYSRLDENWEEWVPADEPGKAEMTAAATESNPVVKASLHADYSDAEYKFYQTIDNLPAGIYIVNMQTRTAPKNNANPDTGKKGFFNAQNDEGVWDKYIFAQVTDAAGNEVSMTMSPFWVGGYNDQGFPTGIYWIRVEDGQKLTIGAVEQYLSGKASGHDWDAELGDYVPARYWDTNTWVRDAKLYFYAPLDGFDYAAAAQRLKQDIETAIENIENATTEQSVVLYNLAGQQVDANYKGIVVTSEGKKFLQK